MLLLLLFALCLSRVAGVDASIVTLEDVEHSIEGTVVEYTFHYSHDNVTTATVVPLMMDRACEETISDGLGIVVEPITVDDRGTMQGRAFVDLQTAGDEIWMPPATGETKGILWFCYGVNVFRSIGDTDELLMINAVRTKFKTSVSFVVSFGRDDSTTEAPGNTDSLEEMGGAAKTRAFVCDNDLDDEGTVTICVESSNRSLWRIQDVLHPFLDDPENDERDATIESVDCSRNDQCRIRVTGVKGDDGEAAIVVGGTASMVSASGENTDGESVQEEFAVTFRPIGSNSKALDTAASSSILTRRMHAATGALTILAWGLVCNI